MVLVTANQEAIVIINGKDIGKSTVKRFEKQHSNPDDTVKCAIEGCNNHVGKMVNGKLTLYTKNDHTNYSVGGHLWRLEDEKKEWIGIICNSCNGSCEEFFLKKGTILVRANREETESADDNDDILACII